MKLFFLLLITTASLSTNAQQVYFSAAQFKEPAQFAPAIKKMAAAVLAIYKNEDKVEGYDDIFRIQFAEEEYQKVLASLDSFDVHSKMDKRYYRVAGFHYRIHSLTMLAIQQDPSKNYEKEYAVQFNGIFKGLPEEGKDQVKYVFQEADAVKEKESFNELINKHITSGKDSLSLNDAIDLVKQWNYWQVYEKTLPLAIKEIKKEELALSIAKQNAGPIIEEGGMVNPDSKIIITHVTLVDVEKKQLLPNTTVTVSGKLISSVQPDNKANIPAGATIIDGKGKYLVPGMTDAHIHFFQSGGLYARPDAIDLRKHKPYEKEIKWTQNNMTDVLKRYIQNGITNVVDVGASLNFLSLREKFRNKTYAPAVQMTGPLLTSYEPSVFKELHNDEPFNLVKTEEEGRKMVQEQLPYKPDFIKIWYILEDRKNPETSARKFYPTVKAIIEEAHKNNLKVAVHATERITAQYAVEAGCDFLVHSVDDEIVSDEFIKLLKSKNTILCPTLIVYGNYRKTFGQELDFSTYDILHSNPEQLGSLYDLKHLPEKSMTDAYKSSIRTSKQSYLRTDSISLVNLKKLSDAGIRIAAGTDAGNIGTMHGTSLVDELEKMKQSGMNNWQILQSATINPSYILNKEKETGSIKAGKIADMFLVDSNPVESLSNLEKISLVINKGFAIAPDTLIQETPVSIVQKQLNAYNARNLDAFMETYHDDVELYDFPGTLLCKGKEQMRKQYEFLNQVPNLHCEIKSRIIQGNIIIDQESVTGFGSKPLEATAVYHVENNKIKKVYFISNK
ncbi:MAG: amidohydrolase family protein [Ferruginibacter sp.]